MAQSHLIAAKESLETRYAAVAAELAALDTSKAGGLPNVSSTDTIDHVGYKMGLLKELETLREQIEEIDGLIAESDGVFEVTSEMEY
jgi:hypothetical protein